MGYFTSSTGVTAGESLQLLGTLDRGTMRRIGGVTSRQVRYLSTQGVLRASGRESSGQGDTRLYTGDDVTLLRLYARLRAADVPAWQIRALLLYLGPALRTAIQRRQDLVLVVDGARASLLRPRQAREAPGYVRVPLREVWQGVTAAVRQLRAHQPTLWAGWRFQPAREAVTPVRTRDA